MARKPPGYYSRRSSWERRRARQERLEAGKINPGWFLPGKDPRRHRFSAEECRRGWESALESMVEKYGESHGLDRDTAAQYICRLILGRQYDRHVEDPFA